MNYTYDYANCREIFNKKHGAFSLAVERCDPFSGEEKTGEEKVLVVLENSVWRETDWRELDASVSEKEARQEAFALAEEKFRNLAWILEDRKCDARLAAEAEDDPELSGLVELLQEGTIEELSEELPKWSRKVNRSTAILLAEVEELAHLCLDLYDLLEETKPLLTN